MNDGVDAMIAMILARCQNLFDVAGSIFVIFHRFPSWNDPKLVKQTPSQAIKRIT